MVDFNKRLGKRELSKPTDPITLYDTLDRASDKGELRRVQTEVLDLWYKERRAKRDVIVKLHTGQGKTLIGLLMLQSKLNEGVGPAVYLCPNNFLIDQTCAQAKQFGIQYCTADPDLPAEFTDSKTILITSVQKLFNGRTKFGIGTHSIKVGCLVMDDCHACIDSIRSAFTMRFAKEDVAYQQLVNLFSSALEAQGCGTYADLRNGDANALLPVPYWEWRQRSHEVVGILSQRIADESKKSSSDPSKRVSRHDAWFTWPLLKDGIQDCLGVVSGEAIEIGPYLCPLDLFGSFFRADHRIFMSATVTDDSFLVKGLRLDVATITDPLISKNERWSGEKMILIPSLIHESLDRSEIVHEFAKTRMGRTFGVIALTPSFGRSSDWEKYGAKRVDTNSIRMSIERLRGKQFDDAVVIANRYDGIDLPDEMCRILIFDSQPHSERLLERYEEQCRSASEITITRLARTIEQGLGRSVRGEKDYSVIILIGAELVKTIRSTATKKHFSNQTQAQIELGLEVAELARDDMAENKTPMEAFHNLIGQCLKRDAGWKAFYTEKMDTVSLHRPYGKVLSIFKAELSAELAFLGGDGGKASAIIQDLLDKEIKDPDEYGWYLQERARYMFGVSKAESNKLQLHAHKRNRYLMKPESGVQVDCLVVVSQKRVANIVSWVQGRKNYQQLDLDIQEIFAGLDFGIRAERFEKAFKELGEALGFASERPEKEWKEGPDNLWGIETGHFLVVECKSEVDLQRSEINKHEAAQMNTACVWFEKNYTGASATKILIIPTNKVSKAGPLDEDIKIMRKKELRTLVYKVKAFFAEFRALDFNSLAEDHLQSLLATHGLGTDNIKSDFCVESKS